MLIYDSELPVSIRAVNDFPLTLICTNALSHPIGPAAAVSELSRFVFIADTVFLFDFDLHAL